MFDIQTSSSRTGLLNGIFPPGVLGEIVSCPPYINSELSMDEMNRERDARTEVCREGKMFNVSYPSGRIQAAHRESAQRLLTCYRQVLSRPQGMLKNGLWRTQNTGVHCNNGAVSHQHGVRH